MFTFLRRSYLLLKTGDNNNIKFIYVAQLQPPSWSMCFTMKIKEKKRQTKKTTQSSRLQPQGQTQVCRWELKHWSDSVFWISVSRLSSALPRQTHHHLWTLNEILAALKAFNLQNDSKSPCCSCTLVKYLGDNSRSALKVFWIWCGCGSDGSASLPGTLWSRGLLGDTQQRHGLTAHGRGMTDQAQCTAYTRPI